ncbi:MAG: hypothetical protein KIT24_12450 [Phycisphaeraceae bacterium]|nr:hypothetical protein [Phycisphaeraceae bacterium]
MSRRFLIAGLVLAAGFASPVLAQEHMPGKVEIAWNRYYTYDEVERQLHEIAQAYPHLVSLVPIGKSIQGRTLWVAIVNDPTTGPHESKPAMWIDGNVHGNEIQACEAVMYSLWYLTKAHGRNEMLTNLLKDYSFYFMPSANPDGREWWFAGAHTPHSARHNIRPFDNDNDGLIDEDPADDLDGDGHITQMWKEDPDGRWRRDPDDPRIFRQVPPGQKGGWTFLGSEGIDNDGDGRINEDDIAADDMNRNYPSDWQPIYVQTGAGEYPLSSPETRAIGEFILAHPNIAAVQSYHNAGGMILRGPGASYRDSMYAAADTRMYDEIANTGAQMLPYYRSMVIHRDLYTVHGGFVNWTAEGLGITSFTNELWTDAKLYQGTVTSPDERQVWLWRDRMVFGQTFSDYKEFDHPQFGKILIGGPNKWSSRNTPTFMLEEECHRNFAFTMYHASCMPKVSFGRHEIRRTVDGLWIVTIEVRNEQVIPTRLAIAASRRLGLPDLLTVEGARVVASGRLNVWFDRQMSDHGAEPARVLLEDGIPGRGKRILRFVLAGEPGDLVTFRYQAEKARDVETVIELTQD